MCLLTILLFLCCITHVLVFDMHLDWYVAETLHVRDQDTFNDDNHPAHDCFISRRHWQEG